MGWEILHKLRNGLRGPPGGSGWVEGPSQGSETSWEVLRKIRGR